MASQRNAGIWIGAILTTTLLQAGAAAASDFSTKTKGGTGTCGLVSCTMDVNVKVGAACGLSNTKVWCAIGYDVWGAARGLAGPATYNAKVEAWDGNIFLADKTASCAGADPLWGFAPCSGRNEFQNWNVAGPFPHCWSFFTVATGQSVTGAGTASAPAVNLCVNAQGGHWFN